MAKLQAKLTPDSSVQARAQYARGRTARAKNIIKTLVDAGMLIETGSNDPKDLIIKGNWNG